MPRQILDLSGDDWQVGQAPEGAGAIGAHWGEVAQIDRWLPARVPGNIHADLIRAGLLPDLNFGGQVTAAAWVDDHCWWMMRTFPKPAPEGGRVHLVLHGVDYLSDLYLNGRHLGRHEGMFSPQVVEVTGLLQEENHLAVRLVGSHWLPADRSSAMERLLNRVEARLTQVGKGFPQRRDVLKCQMSFGWDFAPPLPAAGVWDDVYLVRTDGVFLRDATVEIEFLDRKAHLAVVVEIDALDAGPVRLCCSLAGETFEAEPVSVEQVCDLPTGTSRHFLRMVVPEPHLWWPWDQGQPDLYRLTVEAWQGDSLLDTATRTLGLRQIELRGWTVHVNGRPVYARGANWVPADILPGRVTGQDYRTLLQKACQANMNMLRVWGGGLREKRAFYDLCDRMGILLWQEFPFACAFLTRYPRSAEYLRLVRSEVQAIVRDLRHHASVALWCGGNEFSPRRNRPLVSVLQEVVAAEDPSRPFLAASPGQGDRHNWRVWHSYEPPSHYRQDRAGFASEFGLQALPDANTLRRFIPPDELWPPGPSWEIHGGHLPKLRRYARPFYEREGADLADFSRASQRAQALGLQIGIEHYRRLKAAGCGGVLIWQLNEPWPAISWALLDFYRQPKPAYDLVQRLFRPVLISLDYPLQRYRSGDAFSSDIWLVNDLAEDLPDCRVQAWCQEKSGGELMRFERPADVVACSAVNIGRLSGVLTGKGPWELQCQVWQGSHLLTDNAYDLSAVDLWKPTWKQRAWSWLTSLITPS